MSTSPFTSALAHPLRSGRIVAARLLDDPLWVLFKLHELLSPTGRSRLARLSGALARLWPSGSAHGPSPLALFSRWAHGDRAAVAEELHRAVPAASGRRLAALCRLAVQVDEPELVLRHLGIEDVPGVLRPVVVRATVRAGHYRDAVALGARWPDDDLGSGVAEAHDRLALLEAPLPPPSSPRRPPGQPARVLHLLNNSLPWVQAGYTVRSHHVAGALRDAGLDPIMVTRLGFPATHGIVGGPPEQDHEGVRYLHSPGAPPRGRMERHRRQVAVLGELIDRFDPAVVQSTTPHETGLPAAEAARRAGLPFVYEMRGFLEATWLVRRGPQAEASDHYRMSRDAEGRLAAAADHVVTLGTAMRDDLVARGVDPARITIVPNAVDVERFRPRGRVQAIRQRLRIPPDRHLVGYVGSLVPYEGLDALVDAVARLRADGVVVDGLLVGDGTARADLEHRAARAGVADHVHFAGRVPHEEVVDYYEAIDVFVTPRRDLPVCRLVTPIKPVEAMALERPVVLSDLPALRDLLNDGDGRVVPPGDVDALADEIGMLLADPGLRSELGRRAREGVMATRTWAANAERYRDVFAALGFEPGGTS